MTGAAASGLLAGKAAVIVTMHGKEPLIAPPLVALGLRLLPAPPIDTDRFGSFTRDIARSGSQTDALLAKARAGLLAVPEADFAIASEGAFGPHPQVPFVAANHECVGILGREDAEAIIGRHTTLDTNFAQAAVCSERDLDEFADRIGMPAHGAVIMLSRNGPVVAKGIAAREDLIARCRPLLARHGEIWLEADMRAHCNPARQAAIAAAARDLAVRLATCCARCGHPDWIAMERPGRPCAWCGMPTAEAWRTVATCRRCGHEAAHVIEPERKADPGRCEVCNP